MDSRLEVMVLFVLLTAASSLAQSNDDIREATVRTEQEVKLLQYNLDHEKNVITLYSLKKTGNKV